MVWAPKLGLRKEKKIAIVFFLKHDLYWNVYFWSIYLG